MSVLCFWQTINQLRRSLIMDGQGLTRFAERYFSSTMQRKPTGHDNVRRLWPAAADLAEIKSGPLAFKPKLVGKIARGLLANACLSLPKPPYIFGEHEIPLDGKTLASMQAMAQEKQGTLEKTNLKIGFIPITCATPLIMAHPLGFYSKQGLNVEVTKTAGWALIRDKMINKEYDATHFLSPMPLAISMGLGSNATPMNVATIQNVNGQAITLSLKHKDNRDPKNWKGFKFAIPFEYSMHNFLLRYYLAEAGLNPDTDVQLRVVPPAEMVANLRAGNIDGFLGPDPFNQRAVFEEVGFIHLLTKDLWNGHPCCAFGSSTEFIQKNPNTFAALYRAVLTSAAMARDATARYLAEQAMRAGG